MCNPSYLKNIYVYVISPKYVKWATCTVYLGVIYIMVSQPAEIEDFLFWSLVLKCCYVLDFSDKIMTDRYAPIDIVA